MRYTITKARKCPNCGVALTAKDIRAAGPFPCPTCKVLLRASEYYPLNTLIASLSFVALVFAGLGLRGVHLVHALILAFVPVLFLSANFVKFLILPKIEPYSTMLNLRD
jgi:uncharacterized paraquat-inducible protein A